MATAKIISRAQWIARAIVLAEENHLTGTLRHIGSGVHGEALWQVPSRSSYASYVVHVWPITDGVVCGSTAGSYGRPCGHAGAAILAERQRTQKLSAVSEQWGWWLGGGEW